MEACSNYSQSYDTTDTDHYYDEDHDDNLDGGNPHDRDVITSRGRSRSRSRRKTTASDNVGGSKKTSTTTSRSRIYNKITCPLSLVEQIRQSQGGVKSILPMCNDNDNNNDSDSIQTVKQRQNSIARVTNCMENNVDTVQLAKNYEVYKFANPCGLIHDSNDFYLGRRRKSASSHQQQKQPTTPSTVGSSFSEEDESQNNNQLSDINSPTSQQHTINRRTKNQLGPRSLPSFSTDDEDHFSSRFGLPPTDNVRNCNSDSNDKDVPTLLVMDDQEYLYPSGRSCLASKYFISQRQKLPSETCEGCYYYVDLSTHSSQEFNIVKTFLKNFSERTATIWDNDGAININWKNIHIILPWFVEFQALPLMSTVDTFLLNNALGGQFNNDGMGNNSTGGNNIMTMPIITLSNLLLLTHIAFSCELKTTELYIRRMLRQRLLEPRKQQQRNHFVCADNNIEVNNQEGGEERVGDDIELEWTLDDLRTLAQILQNFDDLRECLWEYAIIVYLPHDLDISNSLELVSNKLFPYLLREGMMQMMIVEGIESSFPTRESTFVNNDNRKTCTKSPIDGSSFSASESTTCSDTTIQTNPSSSPRQKTVTQEKMQYHLHNTIEYLKKFQTEKNIRTISSKRGYGRVVDNEVSEEINDNICRHRKQFDIATSTKNESTTTFSRGVATFSC